MTSIIVRQELIDRINHLLSALFEDSDLNTTNPQAKLNLEVDSFDLFVLLNDLCNVRRVLSQRSPVTLSFRGRRLSDRGADAVWCIPDYDWDFPVPNADLEVEYE